MFKKLTYGAMTCKLHIYTFYVRVFVDVTSQLLQAELTGYFIFLKLAYDLGAVGKSLFYLGSLFLLFMCNVINVILTFF